MNRSRIEWCDHTLNIVTRMSARMRVLLCEDHES